MNEHKQTDQCGFDRGASLSEDTYVCTCGWRSAAPSEKVSETPSSDAGGAAALYAKLYHDERRNREQLERELSAANARAEGVRVLLEDCKQKLLIYYKQTEAEYGGGEPLNLLVARIDRALAATDKCTALERSRDG